MRAFNPLLAVVFGPYLGVIKLRLLLMLVPLALAQDISAQWNSIGDSIVLPVFMLDLEFHLREMTQKLIADEQDL